MPGKTISFYGLTLLIATLLQCCNASPVLPNSLYNLSDSTNVELLISDSSLANQISFTDTSITFTSSDTSGAIAPLVIHTRNRQLINYIFKNYSDATALKLFQSKKSLDSVSTYLPIAGSDSIHFYPPYNDSLPLRGFRIALDPGHIAGDMETAQLEGKFIEIPAKNHPDSRSDISFFEANLTLATALELKAKLEAAGAEVLVTRTVPGITTGGFTFASWWNTRFHQDLDSLYRIESIDAEEYELLLAYYNQNSLLAKKRIFFKLFRYIDFQDRATLINNFHPNMTLILHYNVDDSNAPWNTPTQDNYCMTFVPGAFSEGELKRHDQQLHFLRLLFTEGMSSSITFSDHITQALHNDLSIPIADTATADYLSNYCLQTSKKGVFCRNLALTRNVKGTLCYGEALYQDNIQESLLLNNKTELASGIFTNKRIKEVVEAYYKGIINYRKTIN